MSATAQIRIVLANGDTFQTDVQVYGDGAIGSVRINPTRQALHIQSQSPETLRALARALVVAANTAENLIAAHPVTAGGAS